MDIRRFFGAKKSKAKPKPVATATPAASAAAPPPVRRSPRKHPSDDAGAGGPKRKRDDDGPGGPKVKAKGTPAAAGTSKYFDGGASEPAGHSWSWDSANDGCSPRFKPFDAEQTTQLEEAYSAWSSDKSGEKPVLKSAWGSYEIDFKKMLQKKLESGYERTILRHKGEVQKSARASPSPPAVRQATPKLKKEQKVKKEQKSKASSSASSGRPSKKAATTITKTSASATKKKSGAGEAMKSSTKTGGGGSWFGGRKAPPMAGMKTMPVGKPGCLRGKNFLITGVLESLERDDCEELIKEYGGKILKSIPKGAKARNFLHYAVVGADAGVKKLELLETKKTPQLDEDALFELILASLPAEERAKHAIKQVQPELEIMSVGLSADDAPGAATPASGTKSGIKQEAAAATAKPSSSSSAPPPPPAAKKREFGPQLWTERFKPTTARDLVGNFSAIKKFNSWLQCWKPGVIPRERAVLLSGPPGVGKTSAAHVLLKQVGFNIVEFNASDVRSKNSVKAQVEQMTRNRSMGEYFTGGSSQKKRVALIMDEVDGMSTGDRGGMQELIRILESTQIPIVCCCNDESSEKVRALKKYCVCCPFAKPVFSTVKTRVQDIGKENGIHLTDEAVLSLYEGCNGDIRSMLTTLQLWRSDSKALNAGDVKERMVSASKNVMQISVQENSVRMYKPDSTLTQKMEWFFLDSEMLPFWMYETYMANVSKRQGNELDTLKRAAQAADSFSDSDLIQRSIRGKQNWSLLPLFALTSTAIPSALCQTPFPSNPGFPQMLGKISATNKRKRLLKQMACHTSTRMTGGGTGIRMDYFAMVANALVGPLARPNAGAAGINQVLDFMELHGLTREDWDTVTADFGFEGFFKRKKPGEWIPTKVKSAFTRAYKKRYDDSASGTGAAKEVKGAKGKKKKKRNSS